MKRKPSRERGWIGHHEEKEDGDKSINRKMMKRKASQKEDDD